MPFPLKDERIVITGDLAPHDNEDVKWKLIEYGAQVYSTASKTTSLVIAGASPKQSVMNQASKYQLKVASPDVVPALVGGATILGALSARTGGQPKPFDGLHVVLSGSLGKTHATVRASLERMGASVSARPSSKTDIVVLGDGYTVAVQQAVDDGVAFLTPEQFEGLEAGAPLSDFIGRRDVECEDLVTYAEQQLRAVHAEHTPDPHDLVPGESVSFRLLPSGRIQLRLDFLVGTPIEATMRARLQRRDWPTVVSPLELSLQLAF